MIREEQNGTLTILDSAGKVVQTVGIFDPSYNNTMAVLDKQIAANRLNIQSRTNHETVIDNLQISVNAGHDHPLAPAKPLMKVVSDSGEESWAPFVPALKDLVATPPGTPAPSGSIKVETPDILGQIHTMVKALYRVQFPGA